MDCIFVLVDLTVTNILSILRSTVSLAAIKPIPSNVSIALKASSLELPSCQPDGSTSVEAVYAKANASFEASVSVGAGMTYEWTIIAVDTGDIVETTTTPGILCSKGLSCTTSSKVCVLLFNRSDSATRGR
jgi:hypothetical protein